MLNDEYGIGKFIKFGRLRWVGHVMRITEGDPANKVFCTKPGRNGDRRGGRPQLRWCNELEEDIALFGCNKCRIKVQ